ncbi:hypothetical protein P6U16_01945 [Rhizobium sp. 32-5/1]|nr:hypothetical protein [Rhizobium sp. 32-5/1]WEZ83616.1 hypothetical protein P6U16_01945 [Rhizobium sp. 32-5/1]
MIEETDPVTDNPEYPPYSQEIEETEMPMALPTRLVLLDMPGI